MVRMVRKWGGVLRESSALSQTDAAAYQVAEADHATENGLEMCAAQRLSPIPLVRHPLLRGCLQVLSFCRWHCVCRLLALIMLAGCRGVAETAPAPPVADALLSPRVRASATPTRRPTETAVPNKALAVSVLPSPTKVPADPRAPFASPTSTATATPSLTATLPPETLATPEAETRPDIDVVVDNRAAEFSTTGTWFIGDGGQSYHGDCAWAPRGVQNIAYVRPELPRAGAYEVFAWWCGDPNHDQSQRALIHIHPTEAQVAPYQVYVNLQENSGRWNSLGTYYLEQNGSLGVCGHLDGNVVADAFRFVYRWPEPVIITPTPLPTPFPWTGHPPTPLEQLTCGDLSARLGLVQRFYPHTPMISMDSVTFEDCQAFPRDGCDGTREGWRVGVRYQDMVVAYRVSEDYRLVAIEPPEALASRQLLYLYGTQGDRFFRVDRYPDDTWHLSCADHERTYASHLTLDAGRVETLDSFVRAYSSVALQTPGGIKLWLYGLGERVELSGEDRSRLATFGAELAAAVQEEGAGP